MRQSRCPSCRASFSLSWVVQPRQPILLFHSGVNGLAPEPSGRLMLHKLQKKQKSSCATGQNGVITCTYKLQLLHCPRLQGLREARLARHCQALRIQEIGPYVRKYGAS